MILDCFWICGFDDFGDVELVCCWISVNWFLVFEVLEIDLGSF